MHSVCVFHQSQSSACKQSTLRGVSSISCGAAWWGQAIVAAASRADPVEIIGG
jgi:hypothetical protein